MILRALYDLAQREKLVADRDFQTIGISWAVRISCSGEMLGIEDLRRNASGQGKPSKLVPRPTRVPLQKGRSGTKAPAAFLVDNAKYVFGVPTSGKTLDEREGAEKSRWFREMVARCAADADDAGIRTVSDALDRWSLGERPVSLPADCRSNDLFAFIFAPDIDTFVHERPAVEAWWRRQRDAERERASAGNAGSTSCIITGQSVGEAALFPKAKVPGGQPAGAPLVSFNAGAFESYGLKGSANAPMTMDAAQAAGTALQRLVAVAFANPADPSVSLPRRNLRIGDDTLVCYWSAQENAIADIFASLLDVSDPEAVASQYRSIRRGEPAPGLSDGEFFVLVLSGAQGRIVVREWMPTTVQRLNESLARHFADLTLARNTPQPKDGRLYDYLPLSALLRSLAPFGRQDAIPQALTAALVRAAISGAPYPIGVLTRALERQRAECGRSEWPDLERWDARTMLIKAVLRRNFSHSNLTIAMDPNIRSPGYLSGRLLALLERLQWLALGDVNATLVDRYFGAASATPRTVFVRLLRNSKHHERKALDEPSHAGACVLLKRSIDEVMSYMSAEAGGFPAFLPLDEQGLFMLGYHQQRHAFFSKRPATEGVLTVAAPVADPA